MSTRKYKGKRTNYKRTKHRRTSHKRNRRTRHRLHKHRLHKHRGGVATTLKHEQPPTSTPAPEPAKKKNILNNITDAVAHQTDKFKKNHGHRLKKLAFAATVFRDAVGDTNEQKIKSRKKKITELETKIEKLEKQETDRHQKELTKIEKLKKELATKKTELEQLENDNKSSTPAN